MILLAGKNGLTMVMEHLRKCVLVLSITIQNLKITERRGNVCHSKGKVHSVHLQIAELGFDSSLLGPVSDHVLINSVGKERAFASSN